LASFRPITLNLQGEKLREMPGTCPRDDSVIPEKDVGIHAVCRGICDKVPISDTHWALHCRRCGLRETFPNPVVTRAQLRDFCEKAITKEKARQEAEVRS